MNEPTVAIIGLGLIGGSLARDLAGRGLNVLGHDTDPATLQAALGSGVVHGPLGANFEDIGAADWLVLAVPADAADHVLESAAPHAAGLQLITDVGSTKRAIARAAARLGLSRRFVGSHPLAGDHRGGWQASRAGLFADRRVFLCADGAEQSALRAARALWRLCGARTELMDAADHDRLLARISHLPQVLASALASTLAAAGIGPGALGPGGRDVTRLAASSPDVWTGIMLQNADELQDAIAALQLSLGELHEALASRNERGVRAFLTGGKQWSALTACRRG